VEPITVLLADDNLIVRRGCAARRWLQRDHDPVTSRSAFAGARRIDHSSLAVARTPAVLVGTDIRDAPTL